MGPKYPHKSDNIGMELMHIVYGLLAIALILTIIAFIAIVALSNPSKRTLAWGMRSAHVAVYICCAAGLLVIVSMINHGL